MAENQLIELFHSCDKTGTGRIGPEEFRKLCAEFDIRAADSDAIFSDLDHDGDGEVSLDDFAWGFRSFLSPNSTSAFSNMATLSHEKQVLLERRRSDARLAWSHLVDGIGQPAVCKFLNTSGKKLEELYHELQNAGSSPELVTHFEGALSSLLQDVKRLHDDNQNLEKMFNRERESHLQRLKGLEDELDAQVAKVEAEAREEARLKFEQEKREMMEKMESEMAELQAHLRLFQKVNTVLTKKKEDNHNLKHTVSFENHELRSTLSDTRTNLALVHTEMARIKAEYETKCRELNSHQEAVMQYIDQNTHVQRQLSLLQEANKNLQDTNDSLLSVIEKNGGRISPYCCSKASSDSHSAASEEETHTNRSQILAIEENSVRNAILDDSNIQTGAQYVMQRLMEDIDSGRSTLRDPVECDSDPKSLQEEFYNYSDAESAFKSLESEDSKYSLLRGQYGNKLLRKVSSNQSFECSGDPDRTYKIVFAGDAAVGKSCFIHRFAKGTFANKLGSTLGVDFQIKTVRVDEKNVALQLWDTAGQERFRSMTKTYFRRADGVALLYDVTNERSFLNIRQWVQSILDCTDKQIPILICGNKVDMKEEARNAGATCVDTKYGESLANECGAIFYETSSKSGKNIYDALVAITREMLLREDVEVQTSALQISHVQKKVCC